jgi:SPP1 family predicted phage head-tail adaptor
MRQSGRYRHRITIQSRTETRGSAGEVVVAWVDAFPAATALGGIPAEVLTGQGRELRAAGAPEAETAARINFRHIPGVDQTQRILWNGFVFNIRAIEFDATAAREIRLMCTAGVSDGQ